MTELRSVEIRIEGRPPTPNNHTKNLGYAYATANRWKDTAWKAAMAAVGPDFGPPIQHASVEVVFVVPDRRDRDWDNAIASGKPLLDGIVRAGVLRDDSTKVIRRMTFPDMRYERGNTATIYRITELDAGPELGL